MDRSTMARTGIAGAVAGLGLAVGGVAMASADSPDSADGARPDRGHAAEVLAEELGLEEDVVQEALSAVRDDLRPEKPDTTDATPPEPPTDAERAERQAAFAAALAKELDVSEARVTAALEVLEKEAEADQAELRADMRERLVERLDAAVKEGTLTEADKTSVLKAYDAEVIGGGPRGGFGGGFGGGPHGSGPAGGEAPTT